MRITPLDIRNHTFPRRMSGYDRDEVDGFLRMVSEDYEAALRAIETTRERIRQLDVAFTEGCRRVDQHVGRQRRA